MCECRNFYIIPRVWGHVMSARSAAWRARFVLSPLITLCYSPHIGSAVSPKQRVRSERVLALTCERCAEHGGRPSEEQRQAEGVGEPVQADHLDQHQRGERAVGRCRARTDRSHAHTGPAVDPNYLP